MLYEKITAADKEKIQQYILYYAGDQMHLNQDNDFDAVLKEWDYQKSNYLFSLFGEQFILSKSVNFSTPKEMIVKQMSDHFFTDRVFEDFGYEMQEAFRKTNNASCTYDFNFLYSVQHLVSNKLCAGVEFPIPGGKTLVFQEGTKVIKALGKLAAAYNVTSFEKFRLAHSRILNQKTTSGELCLSIHPLDYMTMSDNTYRWSSCMSWQAGGCYRAGTVEMMNSPCVVVAYLRGAEDMNIAGPYTWNNKKWRNLFIVTPEFITSIKGYPYQNEELTIAAIEWIKELSRNNTEWGEFEPVCKYNYKNPTLPGKNFRFSFLNNGWMYNDFGTIEHYCALNKSFHVEEDKYVFGYGGRATCMCCGGTLYGHSEEYLYCLDCYHVQTCSCCDCELEENDTWTIGDNVYCSSCYSEYAVEDPILEDVIHYDDSLSLYLRSEDDDLYPYKNSILVSHYVWNNPEWHKYFKVAEPHREEQWGNYYIWASECTALGLQLFDE